MVRLIEHIFISLVLSSRPLPSRIRNNYTLKNKVTFSVCDTLHACSFWHHRNSWGDICPLVKNNETLQLRTVLTIPERCFSVPYPFRSTHLGEMN